MGVEDKEILKSLSFEVPAGKVCAVMGPNGSGKSTLANVLAGHNTYQVRQGTVQYQNECLLSLEPHERAQKGLFVAFQNPVAIPGINNLVFMKTIYNAKRKRMGLDPMDVSDFMDLVTEKSKLVGLDQSFWERSVNDDFSGGEKKRNDILQMLLLEPKFMVLDETDSGLDIDAMKLVANAINSLRSSESSSLIITHYRRLLDYVKPDIVYVLAEGRIIDSGDMTMVDKLEAEGYQWIYQDA